MPTPCWLKHFCSIRALVPVSFSLSLSLSLSPSLSFSGWSPGAQRLSEFTFLPGLLRSSWEGAFHLHPNEREPKASVNRASPVSGTLLAFCINQGISASFSLLYFLIGQLWATRFQYIKGPQQIIIRECDMKRILQSLRFILLLSDYFCNIHGHIQVCIILWSKLCDYNTFNICIIHIHTYYIYITYVYNTYTYNTYTYPLHMCAQM